MGTLFVGTMQTNIYMRTHNPITSIYKVFKSNFIKLKKETTNKQAKKTTNQNKKMKKKKRSTLFQLVTFSLTISDTRRFNGP